MIAVAILGVSLTAIFSSEAGAVRVATHAKKTVVATLLARCKMGEIEEKLAKEGFPAISDDDRGDCCEDATPEGFQCEWKITRLELPDPDISGNSASEDSLNAPQKADLPGSDTKDSTDVASQMGSFESGGLTEMAMQYVYPLLQPAIEEQVRRVEVIVNWQEGKRPTSFEVVQYLVSENPTSNIATGLPANLGTTATPTGTSSGVRP
ncbi:MAG: hypothetical protein IPJ88_15160 [Myxococcales bacterium]|nr:MAG: hypothetical protein IPJ88_15160 [Myxococcales bacterium]